MVELPEIERYAAAFLDWLGCAAAGLEQPAARAARETGDEVLALGAAGHVLDYDDTYAPGLAHLSAPTAPVALVLAAERGASVGEALAAYAEGFEAMGALARASHPALYRRGWHPTSVCGVVGAAVAGARLLGAEREPAVAIALLRAGGLRAAFGSDGKALQVGMAASSGATAARLAAAGASVALSRAVAGPAGFEATFGGRFAEPLPDEPRAIEQNWIKAWPCCLQTHAPIEAADQAREAGVGAEMAGVGAEMAVEVRVHPVSLQAAAHGPRPADGLEAKFSIPYLVAYTLIHGAPRVESFERTDPRVADAAERVCVAADPEVGESEALLSADGREFRVQAALGSPARPLPRDALQAKLDDLTGGRFDDSLEDLEAPAASLLEQFSPSVAGGRRRRLAFGS